MIGRHKVLSLSLVSSNLKLARIYFLVRRNGTESGTTLRGGNLVSVVGDQNAHLKRRLLYVRQREA